MGKIRKIAVIGDSIGGLVVGKALLDRGFEVEIFGQLASRPRTARRVQVTPNAMKVLRALALDHKLAEFASVPNAIRGLDGVSGKMLFKTPLAAVCERAYDAPYVQMNGDELRSLLHEALPDGVLKPSMGCLRIADFGDSVALRFADDQEVEADLVVAADGIHSVARKCLFDGREEPRRAGCMYWRTTIPIDSGDQKFSKSDISVWFGPKGHITSQYLNREHEIELTACLDGGHWKYGPCTRESTGQELSASYAGWHASLHGLIARVGEVRTCEVFDGSPMRSWSRGRVTLLGDAAHTMLPFLSQGDAMAMEDGLVLARMLERYKDDHPSALRAYEAIRLPRTRRVQQASRLHRKKFHLASSWARFRRDTGYRAKYAVGLRASAFGAGWIYGYDANAVWDDNNLNLAPHY